MHIELSRVVDLEISAELLQERLTGWAVLAGFTLGPVAPDRWEGRRGSAWAALWTFSVRKVPTVVTVVRLPISRQVAVSLVCSSVWQVELPYERRRLEGEFDRLCGFLCLSPSEERDRLGEEVRRRWQQQGADNAITHSEDGVAAPP